MTIAAPPVLDAAAEIDVVYVDVFGRMVVPDKVVGACVDCSVLVVPLIVTVEASTEVVEPPTVVVEPSITDVVPPTTDTVGKAAETVSATVTGTSFVVAGRVDGETVVPGITVVTVMTPARAVMGIALPTPAEV